MSSGRLTIVGVDLGPISVTIKQVISPLARPSALARVPGDRGGEAVFRASRWSRVPYAEALGDLDEASGTCLWRRDWQRELQRTDLGPPALGEEPQRDPRARRASIPRSPP